MNSRNDRIGKIQYYSFLLIAFTIPLSQYVSVRVLILALALALWRGSLRIAFYRAWDMLLYFLVLAFGLFISEYKELGLHVLETRLSLITIPIIISMLEKVDESILYDIGIAFITGTGVACVALITNAGMTYMETGSGSAFLFKELTDILDFQPTYFAYFLVFVITFALYQFYYKPSFRTWYAVVGILLLFGVLMLTGGRTAFISILLAFSFFVLKFLLERPTERHWVAFILVGAMGAGLLIVSYFSGGDLFSDSWERFDLWKAAINATDNVWIGVGTGDEQQALNVYYNLNGWPQFAEDNLNAHNQFLHSFLASGLLGLAALLLMMTRPLYLAFQNNHPLTILVLFPFFIYGMTEVFLGRYQGVVFFSFLHQIYIARLLPSVKRRVLPISG